MSEHANIAPLATDGAPDTAQSARRMRTLLICHEGAELDRVGLAHWLASFSDLAGVVVLREPKQRMWRRIRREIKRVGLFRFADVLAFRLYYRFALAAQDRAWEQKRLAELRQQYPVTVAAPELLTDSPNSPEAEAFIRAGDVDIVIARCKTLLKERIFSLPAQGTFVMHPGICPEYRNAHGCFWALAQDDLTHVGMTLLRIDRGVDTGPVYGYYTYGFDELRESHARIQQRSVLDNLDALAAKLREVYQGTAAPLDTTGRASATWGQPWLSKYLAWRRNAQRRQRAARATTTNGAPAGEGRRG